MHLGDSGWGGMGDQVYYCYKIFATTKLVGKLSVQVGNNYKAQSVPHMVPITLLESIKFA